LLNQAGYYTAAVGKMHFYPWDITHGFQYRVAAEDKRWIHVRDDYSAFLRASGYRKLHGDEHPGYHAGKGAVVSPLPSSHSVDCFVGEEACRFIRSYGSEGPFALMVGFPGPHCPYDPTPDYLAQVDETAIPAAIPEVVGNAPELRRRNVEANRKPWNGVDYALFEEDHKHKIRTHYAALVKQIDDQVGAILQTLADQDLLDNTVIIFASDHGDHLGDHNLIGKGDYYESSIHVPLLVRGLHTLPATEEHELVALGDVTATLLALAGVELPAYLDSRPLPGVGAGDQGGRQYLFGMLSEGWMIFDGEWKLSKYATGESLLFNLSDDPHEQSNLIDDPRFQTRYLELDRLLTEEIMASLVIANNSQRVYTNSLSDDPGFGRRGWQRVYPNPID
jgi:arylsulfatase A-like enzyme